MAKSRRCRGGRSETNGGFQAGAARSAGANCYVPLLAPRTCVRTVRCRPLTRSIPALSPSPNYVGPNGVFRHLSHVCAFGPSGKRLPRPGCGAEAARSDAQSEPLPGGPGGGGSRGHRRQISEFRRLRGLPIRRPLRYLPGGCRARDRRGGRQRPVPSGELRGPEPRGDRGLPGASAG